jgi:methionine aminotransferase
LQAKLGELGVGPSPDLAASERMTVDVGVCCLPTSAFFSERQPSPADSLLRFCFAKSDDEIESAGARLGAMRL